MARGKRPDVDAFATLLRWLEEPVEKFVRQSPSRADDDSVAAVSLFFKGERNVRPADVDAYEDLIRAATRALDES